MTAINPGGDIVADIRLAKGIALDAGKPADPARAEPARGDKVARDLEGAFARLLISQMRGAGLGDDALFPGAAGQYRDLYDQELAKQITLGRGLGLQDAIRKQLGVESRAVPVASMSAAATRVAEYAPAKSTPEEFVARIWPHAVRAAKELGVPAKTLVAQAALETGWGRKTLRGAGGEEANNLFGIKATANWRGERVTASTTEYAGGVMQRERAGFRAYASPADSFADYVNLLRSNPRYANCLDCGGDGSRFAQSLQRAGYATDPHYAAKLHAIAEGPTLRRALAQIEGTADGTSLRV